jgi:hypothetical protein
MCSRVRRDGYVASGIHLALVYKNGSWWHKGRRLSQPYFDSRDLYRAVARLLIEALPTGRQATPVLNIAVSCFGLTKSKTLQLDLFRNEIIRRNLVKAEDLINERWGNFTIGSARSFDGAKVVQDRIAFGGVKELEEFTLRHGSGL